MQEIVLLSALALAFLNGANDNMKAVATLYGSGTLAYPRALALATLSTAAGGLASLVLAGGLVRAFSARGIVPEVVLAPGLLAAVAIGAAVTLLLATRLGLPISTTHALLGSLIGAGWIAAGPDLALGTLGSQVAAPLLLSPLAAGALAWTAVRAARRRPARHGSGGSVDPAVDAVHVLSGSLVGFARGLNDTPKILGLLVGAAVLAPLPGALAITAAMALGGVVAARPVAETLAHRLTSMTSTQGLAANLTTSLFVIGASGLAFPVSTTHVSTGGILGIGVAGGRLRWGPAREVLASWVTTLPLAALLGGASMWALG